MVEGLFLCLVAQRLVLHSLKFPALKNFCRELSSGFLVAEFICSTEFLRMAVMWPLYLVFSYFQLFVNGLFGKTCSYSRSPPSSATKPICIVTGANSGLGAAVTNALCREGYYVILAGRSLDLLSKTIEEIKQQQKDVCLKAFPVDLSSFESILKFKNSVQQWLLDSNLDPSIQLLVNNAGMLARSQRFTVEGFDLMMGTNYIGAYALTHVLFPLLKNSCTPSRVVNVTSFTHRCVSDIQVDVDTLAGRDLHGFSASNRYPCASRYEYSKLCLLLFSYELHRQFCLIDLSHQITVMAADPGVVKTGIMREVPSCLSLLAFCALKLVGLLRSPENGVESIIDAALAPPEATGKYFFGGKGRTIKSSACSYDAKLAEKLWISSGKLFCEAQLRLQESKEVSCTAHPSSASQR